MNNKQNNTVWNNKKNQKPLYVLSFLPFSFLLFKNSFFPFFF